MKICLVHNTDFNLLGTHLPEQRHPGVIPATTTIAEKRLPLFVNSLNEAAFTVTSWLVYQTFEGHFREQKRKLMQNWEGEKYPWRDKKNSSTKHAKIMSQEDIIQEYKH